MKPTTSTHSTSSHNKKSCTSPPRFQPTNPPKTISPSPSHPTTQPPPPPAVQPSHTFSRLDALLAVLKTCKGRACTHPWSVLHPANDVSDLHDALDARFDEYYEVRLQDQRVHFTKCEKGYIAESEGPDGIEPLGMMVDEVAF